MIRSRRLVLASLVVALGLASCGDPSTTAPLAQQPRVIQLASGQTGTAGGAAADASVSASPSAESKIAFMGRTDFVYDGTLPALDGAAGSWFFASGAKAEPERIAQLAKSLGVVGEVRALSADQGGGWAVGPEDYSAAVLSVGSDGMLSWYLSSGPTASVAVGCAAMSGVATEPTPPPAPKGDTQVDVTLPGATAIDGGPAVDARPGVMPPGVDVVAPECGIPTPPADVPTKDQALAKAKQLFADWGYDVNSYQFDEPYADEWGASVNASLILDGFKAPIMLSVGFGENGAVTYASGSLAMPQRGADYPTVGAAAGLERLKTQQNQYVGFERPGVLKSTDEVATDGATTNADTGVGAPAIAPDIATCNAAAATDCPVNTSEPVTVTLNSVKADLTMVWAADNMIWLLPAYTFGTVDGGVYTVIAVEDAYIQQADPSPATTEPIAVDPGGIAVPGTAPAGGGTVGAGGSGGQVPDTAVQAPGVLSTVPAP